MNKRKGRNVLFLALLAVVLGMVVAVEYGRRAAPHSNEPIQQKPANNVPAQPPEISQGEWNTFHGDSALRGVADASFPERLEVRWRLKTRAPVEQPPVVSGGIVFVVTARGEIIAANLDGKEVWARELFTGEIANNEPVRRRIEAPPACFGGILFVGCDENILFAMDAASGRDLWQLKLESPVRGAPNFEAGRVYVIDRADGVLVCVDAKSGNVIGRGTGVGRSDAPPSVSAEAVVYGSCACEVHVCSPVDAKRLRDIKLDADSQVAGGVALSNGQLVSGSRSGKIIAADISTGATVWINRDPGAEVFATPAVNGDWVIASSYDGFVYGIARGDGTTRWRYDTDGGMPLSPVIAGDQVIVAVEGELLLLRLADGAKVWSLKLSDRITEPAVVRGRIFVGSEDGTVVCLSPAIQ
ncbi:MAG TPA: PQQ-binding-like beta-propeller repeat protein [Candidatus Hydrogenedentes bacterium]|nr:PQQ-binding-like beta-propeller repeat protein [Candidatus Hydrogenedentota bacterium]